MKKILTFLTGALFLLTACNTSPESQENEATDTNPAELEYSTVYIDLDVNGMTCTGCENTIKTGVSELEGVVSVDASHMDAKTMVEVDTSYTSLEKIKAAITEKGYEVAGAEVFAEKPATENEALEE